MVRSFLAGKLLISPKRSNSQLIFPDDDCENQYLTPNDLYQIQSATKRDKLSVHLNISSISCHIDDSASLITNCKTKQNVIGVSEYRIRTSRLYDYILTECLKLVTLIYLDKSLKYKSRKNRNLVKPKEI